MSSAQELQDAVKFWLLILAAVAVSVLVGREAIAFPPAYVLGAAACAGVALVTFVYPKAGLAIVVFSMIFSPKVEGMQISDSARHGAAIFKLNDILLIVISLAWMGRTAVFKGRAFLVKTPLNAPILAFSAACLVSTLLGIIRGDLPGALRPIFYFVKYVEYYLMFFMTVNIVESREDVRRLLKYGLYTALLVTLVAYAQIPSGQRVTAPFDAPINMSEREVRNNEANTFGGYYLVVFGLLLGHFTQSVGNDSLAALASLLFMLTPFFLTLSRSSYIGLAAALIFHVLATPKRQLALLFGMGLGLLLVIAVPRLRQTITTRVESTFGYGERVSIGGASVSLEGSTMARVKNWKWVFTDRFPERPVVGYGVTGVGLCDAYYPLLAGETGLVGMACFAWLISRIWGCAWGLFKISDRVEDKALGLGLLTALVGLLCHAVGANSFIIVRIMEPFWFLTALMVRIYVDEASSINPAAV